MEADVRQKNEQLEELYALIDSMQESVTQLESEKEEKQAQVAKLQVHL